MSDGGCVSQLNVIDPSNVTENMQLATSPVNLTFMTCPLKFFP